LFDVAVERPERIDLHARVEFVRGKILGWMNRAVIEVRRRVVAQFRYRLLCMGDKSKEQRKSEKKFWQLDLPWYRTGRLPTFS